MSTDQPYADIKRVGRFKHEITIRHHAIEWVTFLAAYGRRRAERKAATELGFSENHWQEGQAEVQGRVGLKPDVEVLSDIDDAETAIMEYIGERHPDAEDIHEWLSEE